MREPLQARKAVVAFGLVWFNLCVGGWLWLVMLWIKMGWVRWMMMGFAGCRTTTNHAPDVQRHERRQPHQPAPEARQQVVLEVQAPELRERGQRPPTLLILLVLLFDRFVLVGGVG